MGFCVWEVATRKHVGYFFDGTEEAVRSVAFSPDGRLLAAGKDDGSLELWEVLTWTLLGRRQGPDGRVFALAFSSDGRVLASGHEDTTALLWDVSGVWAAGRPDGRPLTPTDLDVLWRQLGEGESAKAYRALGTLARNPEKTLELLRQRLRPMDIDDKTVVRNLRAVALLEQIGTPEARRLLEALARGATGARLTREAKVSLERLAKRHPAQQ
jgi:hypothetical protein